MSQGRKLTYDEFVNRSNLKHEFKYRYLNVKYINSSTKVCINCPTHGDFWQTPNQHLMGQGCTKCGYMTVTSKLKLSTVEFRRRAQIPPL